MKRSSKIVLAVVAVLIVALAAIFVLRRPPVPDAQQIQGQIEAARVAAQNGNISGIMRIVSAQYKDSNGLNVDQLHFALGRLMRNAGAADVVVTPPQITVQGDRATSSCDVKIISRQGHQTFWESEVRLQWQREDGHRFGVIPSKVWRVTSAVYSAGSLLGEG